jgi:hypothetical protein
MPRSDLNRAEARVGRNDQLQRLRDRRITQQVSGGDFEEATPDPIPNSEVKLFGADGTAREAVWESRTPPGFFMRSSERENPQKA